MEEDLIPGTAAVSYSDLVYNDENNIANDFKLDVVNSENEVTGTVDLQYAKIYNPNSWIKSSTSDSVTPITIQYDNDNEFYAEYTYNMPAKKVRLNHLVLPDQRPNVYSITLGDAYVIKDSTTNLLNYNTGSNIQINLDISNILFVISEITVNGKTMYSINFYNSIDANSTTLTIRSKSYYYIYTGLNVYDDVRFKDALGNNLLKIYDRSRGDHYSGNIEISDTMIQFDGVGLTFP